VHLLVNEGLCSAARFYNTPELHTEQTELTQNGQDATQNKTKRDTRKIKVDRFGPRKIM
jgi:hypothetical protein